MKHRRYFTEQAVIYSHPAIHGFVGDWHGIWIDDHTLIAVADISAVRLSILEAGHPTITVLPSLYDNADVHKYLNDRGRQAHSQALINAGAPHPASMFNIATFMSQKFSHPFFKPQH